MWMEILKLMRVEMVLTISILLLVGLQLGRQRTTNSLSLKFTGLLLVLTLVLGVLIEANGMAFGSMFYSNNLLRLEKNMLVLATLLITCFAYDWIKLHQHGTEFLLLMMSTLLGMCFMLSAGNLLMFYLGLELSTIPLAAMAAFDLHKNKSAEAAFKMIISSAFASCIMLFGLSWIYGSLGTINLDAIRDGFTDSPLLLMGLGFVVAGLGFKISAVPFHLWTADVYEGAPINTTAFLSVASKAAVLFATLQLLYVSFRNASAQLYPLLCVLAAATMLAGNLFALQQNNIKRLLAFSSITQVGFILLGMSAQHLNGASATVFFLLVYLFSNLAAFGVASVVHQQTGAETIDAYRGLYQSNPALSWLMAIALFSLAGVPPTAGFFGKFFLLLAGAGRLNWWIIVFAALNMMISLYYYLRVVKAMFVDQSASPLPKIATPALAKLGMIVCLLGIIITGMYSGAYEYIRQLFA